MSKDIGQKAIDLFVYLAEGCRTVEFVLTGGEPLIEVSILEYLIRYADKRCYGAGIQPQYVLKTNGTILNGEIIKFLQTYNVTVVVSIDGTSQVHNRHRMTTDGQDTHEIVMRNLGVLRDNHLSCVASITVHSESVKAVIENVRFLHTFGINRIDVGPVYGTVSWSSADITSFVQSLMEVADYMQEQNTREQKLEVGPLFLESEHVGGVLMGQWGCRAGSSNLAFLPNGKITGCSALAMIASQFPDLVVGDVYNGLNQLAVDRLLKIAQAGKEARKACLSCEVAIDCAGGCLAINYSTTGTPFLPPAFYCETIAAIPSGWYRAWGGLVNTQERTPQHIGNLEEVASSV